MTTPKSRGPLSLPFALLLFAGCGLEAPLDAEANVEPLIVSASVPADVDEALGRAGRHDERRVYTVEHDVRVARGRRVHVTERFSIGSWRTWPHRGVLLLPGPVVTGSVYALDVEGYDLASELARQGMFSFALDYEGTGLSTQPVDGASVNHSVLLEDARAALRALGLVRLIPRMDILGESNGGAVAAELCADARRTRSCVLGSMLYVEGTPFFQAIFLDPGFLAFLSSQPGGYLLAGPEMYFNVVGRSPPEVAGAVLGTQPGLYATGPLFAPASLPYFDPTHALVPALVIRGADDNIATAADADALVAAYGSAVAGGGAATLVVLEGAGHIPRLESAEVSSAYRRLVTDFLAPPRRDTP